MKSRSVSCYFAMEIFLVVLPLKGQAIPTFYTGDHSPSRRRHDHLMSYPINVVSHDSWHERDRPLIEDPPELTPVLQERLKCLSESLSETLHPALILERRFGEQNNKAMFLAPFIRSVIHASATDIDIQHISLFPLAVDPCITPDPLFRTFLKTVRPPCYGLVTGIICGSVPFPIDRSESNEDEIKSLSVEDFVDEGESDSEESYLDAEDWLNGYRKKKKGTLSTTFYYNRTPPASDRSTFLHHSFLARITVDLAEEKTPLALFCMGEMHELQSAMTSCLFQRSAWGIRDSLIGITLGRTTTVQILVGWLENTAESDCFVVHIAQDASGCYDLSEASEAFQLASILANVSRRFSPICKAAIAFTDKLKQDVHECRMKNWRLDQTELAPCVVPEKEPPFNTKIHAWLAGVNEPIKDADSLLEPASPTNMAPRTQKPTIKVSKEQDSDDTSSAKPPLKTKASTDSLAPPVESSVGKTASLSASSLAAGHGEDDKCRRTRFWLFSRMAITRTLYPPILLQQKYSGGVQTRSAKVLTQEEPLYQSICTQYYSLTSFSWLDTVKAPLEKQFSQLSVIKGLEAEKNVAGVKMLATIGQHPEYRTLSQECSKVLLANLLELESVYSDLNKFVAVGTGNASEAECRRHIDRLIMRLFHGNIEGTADEFRDYNKPHIMVSLERALMLPRAYVAEVCTDPDEFYRDGLLDLVLPVLTLPLEADRIKLTQFVKENRSNLVVTDPPTIDPRTLGVRFQEDMDALRKVVALAEEENDPKGLKIRSNPEELSNLRRSEPDRAICDSVGFIRVQNVFTANTASAAFNLIHPPTKAELDAREAKLEKLNSTSRAAGARKLTTTALFREEQLGREAQVEQPNDLFAHAQNLQATLRPSKPVLKRPTLSDTADLDLEPGDRHSLEASEIQVRGKDDGTTAKVGVVDIRKDLFLPIIVAEHKKVLSAFTPTHINQGRIYATAAIKFYAAMGIYGLGVYTVISEGPVILVTVSYGEKAPEPLQEHELPPFGVSNKKWIEDPTKLHASKVNIVERHPCSFNITNPLGLIHFASFLIKLRIEYVPWVVEQLRKARSKGMQGATVQGGSLDLKEEMKSRLKNVGIPLGGQYKATWRVYKEKGNTGTIAKQAQD